jgi:hypothetical protein
MAFLGEEAITTDFTTLHRIGNITGFVTGKIGFIKRDFHG